MVLAQEYYCALYLLPGVSCGYCAGRRTVRAFLKGEHVCAGM